MPFKARGSRFRGPRRPPRAREWFGFGNVNPANETPTQAISFTTVAPPAGVIYANYIFSPDDLSAIYDEPTLMRCLISIDAVKDPDQGTPVVNYYIGMGLIGLTIEAAGGVLPAAALPFVPNPWLDADSAWIWTKQIRFQCITGFGGFQVGDINRNYEDVRTRRKFPNGMGLAFVIVVYASTGSQVLQVNVAGRGLWLNS